MSCLICLIERDKQGGMMKKCKNCNTKKVPYKISIVTGGKKTQVRNFKGEPVFFCPKCNPLLIENDPTIHEED